MKGNLWTLLVIALVCALALPAINIGFSDAAVADNATESSTVDYDQNYTLENSDVYEFTKITVNANSTTLSEGADYLFDADNGTINWQDTIATSDGDAATIEYDYRDHDQRTTTQATILRTIAVPVGFLVMMVAFGYMLVGIFADPY